MLLSPAASPPEVQQMSVSPVASPPAPPLPITTPPPIFSPISPEVSPPPPHPLPHSPALPPELPPPIVPAISPPAPPPLPITLSPPEVAPPTFTLPITSPPLPPPIPLPIPSSQPPPAASFPLTPSPPQPSNPPELSQPPPWKPKHLPSPELSQPPPWMPKHLPSPELKTHLPISPQNSPDPKFLSAPPTMTPHFFPLTNGPPPPALGASSPPSVTSPTLSSSDFTAVRNQTTLDSEQSHHVSPGIVLGCVLGGVLLIAVVAVLYLCCRNRKRAKKTDNGKPWLGLKDTSSALLPEQPVQSVEGHIVTFQPKSQSSPHITTCNNSGSRHQFQPQNLPIALSLTSGTFTYDELEVATNGFSQVNLLGEGGFGYVHKGVLSNGREIAVKKLRTSSKQGEREFQAEVETFSQVHHKHLVTLVGYCITGSERLLVYEFIPNKTLEFHLHGKEQPTVEWATRLKIAVGSAKGLAYLHEDCNPTIIHRDIKAANILLDFKFDAKVSDFGLAKFFSDNTKSYCITHISTRVVGTFGYLAPEYASSGKVTEKSDVYSFGVMLLELITGSPPICTSQEPVMNEGLVGWARPLLTQALEDGNYNNLADPNLQGNYNTSEMASMVACAAACVRHSAWLRPRMSQIVRTLQGDVSPAHLNDGPRPGHSMIFGASECSNSYDANQYKEDLKKYNRALVSLEHGITRYSGSTSEFGLNQSESGSSCEMQRST